MPNHKPSSTFPRPTSCCCLYPSIVSLSTEFSSCTSSDFNSSFYSISFDTFLQFIVHPLMPPHSVHLYFSSFTSIGETINITINPPATKTLNTFSFDIVFLPLTTEKWSYRLSDSPMKSS